MEPYRHDAPPLVRCDKPRPSLHPGGSGLLYRPRVSDFSSWAHRASDLDDGFDTMPSQPSKGMFEYKRPTCRSNTALSTRPDRGFAQSRARRRRRTLEGGEHPARAGSSWPRLAKGHVRYGCGRDDTRTTWTAPHKCADRQRGVALALPQREKLGVDDVVRPSSARSGWS